MGGGCRPLPSAGLPTQPCQHRQTCQRRKSLPMVYGMPGSTVLTGENYIAFLCPGCGATDKSSAFCQAASSPPGGGVGGRRASSGPGHPCRGRRPADRGQRRRGNPGAPPRGRSPARSTFTRCPGVRALPSQPAQMEANPSPPSIVKAFFLWILQGAQMCLWLSPPTLATVFSMLLWVLCLFSFFHTLFACYKSYLFLTLGNPAFWRFDNILM